MSRITLGRFLANLLLVLASCCALSLPLLPAIRNASASTGDFLPSNPNEYRRVDTGLSVSIIHPQYWDVHDNVFIARTFDPNRYDFFDMRSYQYLARPEGATLSVRRSSERPDFDPTDFTSRIFAGRPAWEGFQVGTTNRFDSIPRRSTSCRSMLRTGRRLAQAHQEVGRSVRGAPQVVGDETGWRVDGSGAWLHAFVGLTAPYYQIDPTRSLAPAKRLLGMDWSGIFGHDGWSIYDHFTDASHQQCLAHLFRRCETLIEQNTGGALWFPRQVKSLLKTGIEFRNRFVADEMTVHGTQVMAGRLTMQMWDSPPDDLPSSPTTTTKPSHH